MKNIFIYSIIISISFLFCCGCSEDLYNVSEDSKVEIENSIEPKIKIVDGIMMFDSAKTVFSTIDQLGKMSDKERDEWEQSIGGFTSMRKIINDTYDKIDKIDREEDFYKFMDQNKALLKIVDNEIFPIIESTAYICIINESGEFYVGDILHKVTPNEVIIYDTTEEGLKSTKEIMQVPHKRNNIIQANVNCGQEKSSHVYNDGRKLEFKIYIDQYIAYQQGSNLYVQLRSNVNCQGKKKGLFSYKAYNTTYDCYNVRYTIMNIPVYDNILNRVTHVDVTQYFDHLSTNGAESSNWTWWYNQGIPVIESYSNPTAYFSMVEGIATSRGIYPSFCEISCN